MMTPNDVITYSAGAFLDATLEDLAIKLGLQTEMGKAALKVALENVKLLDDKQQDYGSGNIAAFGEKGVLVRCVDKTERLKQLVWRSKTAKNEKVFDSWQDLANYAMIAQLCNQSIWK
jgi:methionyl-tRNA formyltransferase